MDLKMKLDKKSLIQMVVLIVLIIGGAAAYLMQQEGGLGFITSMFGGEPAGAPPPPRATTVRAVKKPASAPAGSEAAKPVAAETPAAPATGQVHGKPSTIESSRFEGGVLTLRPGKDANADIEVKVTLPGSPWETPAGKKFKVTEADAEAPTVTLARMAPGQAAPVEQKFTGKYAMTLEFAAEKDKKLPGKIQLSLPDEAKSHVSGNFEAEIRGFRIVDGKPDLSADSVDTLQYLALRELLKDDPQKPIEIIGFRDARYDASASPGEKMTGFIAVEYRVGKKSPTVQKFKFEKDAGVWKVVTAAGKKRAG